MDDLTPLEKQIVTELAAGAAELRPLIQRIRLRLYEIDDQKLTDLFAELVDLDGRMWVEVSKLLNIAIDLISIRKEVTYRPVTDQGDLDQRDPRSTESQAAP